MSIQNADREVVPMAIAWASYPYAEHVVVVTGGGSGIGRAVAVAFLEQGATVCVLGRSDATLRETVAGWGDRASAWVVDVTQRDEVDRVVANIVARQGRIDVVVNNAGLSEHGHRRLRPLGVGPDAGGESRRAHPRRTSHGSPPRTIGRQLDRDVVGRRPGRRLGPVRVQRDEGWREHLGAEPRSGSGTTWDQGERHRPPRSRRPNRRSPASTTPHSAAH